MAPLPGTRVIHPRFGAHHAPVAAGGMTATVQLRRPTNTPTRLNETTGRSEYPPPPVLWEGPARIQHSNGLPLAADAGGQDTTVTRTVVSLPADAPAARVEDEVLVVTCPDDQQLVGVVLRVRDLWRSSLRFQRDLACSVLPPVNRT